MEASRPVPPIQFSDSRDDQAGSQKEGSNNKKLRQNRWRLIKKYFQNHAKNPLKLIAESTKNHLGIIKTHGLGALGEVLEPFKPPGCPRGAQSYIFPSLWTFLLGPAASTGELGFSATRDLWQNPSKQCVPGHFGKIMESPPTSPTPPQPNRQEIIKIE